jgi:hypothetical protein
MRTLIRTLLVASAGIGCVASATACTSTPRVGLHTLGWADTGRPFHISAARSVAVAFTPARDGSISGVNVVASRGAGGPVGLLAYVVTPDDPASETPAKPVAAAAGSEPECWGSLADSAFSSTPRALTVYGTACPVQAGHRYWIQLSTVLGPANLYARQGNSAGHVLVQSAPGGAWAPTNVTGGLEISPVTHAAAA